jgi:hypothetical protein
MRAECPELFFFDAPSLVPSPVLVVTDEMLYLAAAVLHEFKKSSPFSLYLLN